jgi:hypothetical protein
MRPEEELVGRALVTYLGGALGFEVLDGEDPPDLYVVNRTSRIGVEVSRLSQFTLESDGTTDNRATQDAFGLRVLQELNSQIGPALSNDVSLFLGLEVPVSNPSRFRRALIAWVRELAAAPVIGPSYRRKIEGSEVSISVCRERPSRNKIGGFIVNKNSSSDISLNARMVLEDRIQEKDRICRSLSGPIWLALINDYWLADVNTYNAAYKAVGYQHCFERILLVSTNGTVDELTTEA